MSMNGYRERVRELFDSPDLTPLDFCLMGWGEERSLRKKCEYKRRIARSNFGCLPGCYPKI